MKRAISLSLVLVVCWPLEGAAFSRSESIKLSWYLQRAEEDMRIKSYRAAIEAYEAILKIDPLNKTALRTLGFAYEHHGLRQKAVDQYERYLTVYPGDTEIATRLGDLLSGPEYRYREKDAIRYQRLALGWEDEPEKPAPPKDRKSLREQGLAHEAEGKFNAAIRAYRRHLKIHPNDPEIAFRLADILSWSRFNKRRREALYYYQLGLRHQDDEEIRKKYEALKNNPRLAIDDYKRALEKDPNDRQALRSLGLAFEAQGEFDEAIRTYERYLSLYPNDSDIAFRLAGILSWSKYADRKEDALRTYKLGLTYADDPRHRLAYAQLLAADKATSREAARQFRKVLDADPDNQEALIGLARALAWTANPDRALYYSRKAAKKNPGVKDLQELVRVLEKDRGGDAGLGVDFFSQHGGKFDLDGITGRAIIHVPLNSFLLAGLEGGHSTYSRRSDDEEDSFASASIRYGIRSRFHVLAEGGFHSIGPESRGWVAAFQTGADFSRSTVRAGFERSLRTDSLDALSDARDHRFTIEAAGSVDWGEYWIRPFTGWVTDRGLPDNNVNGVDFRLAGLIRPTASAGLKGHISGYERDPSGSTFSPNLFVNQTPFLRLASESGRLTWSLEGGPSFQYLEDAGTSGETRWGGEAEFWLRYALRDNLVFQAGSGFTQISDVYDRFSANATIQYSF